MGTVSSESPKVQYSVQREQSDGSLNRISVRVPYFSKDDIHVYVDDVEINSSATEQSTYTWRWDGDYIAITPNVASGSEVLVRRITPINEAIHIFDGRSEFDDQSMDENFQQLIYIAQEYSEGSGIKDVFSDINMHGYKIRNVGWATDDDDVVTYGQYKKDAEGAKVAMQKAEAAATKAEQHEQNTQAIANQAQTDITVSKEAAITEITDRIATEVDKARVHAVTAQSAAGTAVSASNRSETILQHVQALENEVELHAGTAEAAKDSVEYLKDEYLLLSEKKKKELDEISGTYYIPAVDNSGNLTWTNTGNKANPSKVNIKGPKGDTGATGPRGSGIEIKDTFDTYEEFIAKHPTGRESDVYFVGNDLYIWSVSSRKWVNKGPIASGGGITGLMDPDPVEYFDAIYGESHGDIIGDLVVNVPPISPSPVNTFENSLL